MFVFQEETNTKNLQEDLQNNIKNSFFSIDDIPSEYTSKIKNLFIDPMKEDIITSIKKFKSLHSKNNLSKFRNNFKNKRPAGKRQIGCYLYF